MEPAFPVVVRGLSLTGFIVVLFFLTAKVIRSYRYYSWGQKFLAGGLIGTLLYVADALREAIAIDTPWRLRLIPLFFGLVCLVFYIAEPDTLARKRWGKDPLKDKEDEL